jgi:hypothetical protein
MCENLEVSLSQSLEAFRGTQVQEVTALQAEADQMTEAAEQSFAKYLNGRQYASEDNVGSWNKLSEQVSNGFTKTWRDSADLTRFRRGNSNVSNSKADKKDPSLVMATTAANLRLTLEHIRLAQTSAELKRFQLLQKLVSIKVRYGNLCTIMVAFIVVLPRCRVIVLPCYCWHIRVPHCKGHP